MPVLIEKCFLKLAAFIHQNASFCKFAFADVVPESMLAAS
jgi:hypothetical protein